MVNNPADQSDDPDQERLDALGRRIEAARGPSSGSKTAEPSGRLNFVYRLSSEFVAAVFVGLALGWGFDRLTGLKPLGIVLFSMLGIAAAFYSVFRAIARINAEQRKEGK